ncbi:cation:proton antiporter [Deinococcus saxicola]|uniref:hypothetical protein n=1 Tax=Deinococcus saxicola TaxID=249406 RepID=UPI0039EE114A
MLFASAIQINVKLLFEERLNVIAVILRALGARLPITLLEQRATFAPYTRRLMIWSGLRGGLTLALAFTVPEGEFRNILLVMSYGVVIFSLLVQGLTIPKLARRATAAAEAQGTP